jgi:hypothetical protein
MTNCTDKAGIPASGGLNWPSREHMDAVQMGSSRVCWSIRVGAAASVAKSISTA